MAPRPRQTPGAAGSRGSEPEPVSGLRWRRGGGGIVGVPGSRRCRDAGGRITEMPAERRQRDGGGAGMAGAGSRRCRDDGGGMAEVPGWRGQDHGGVGITESSLPAASVPLPAPRGCSWPRTPAEPRPSPAASPRRGTGRAAAPVRPSLPRPRSGCSSRAHPGCGGTAGGSAGEFPVPEQPWPRWPRGDRVPSDSALHGPARHGPRFPGAVPRGSGTSGRPVIPPRAAPGAAGAAVPVSLAPPLCRRSRGPRCRGSLK